MKHYKKRERDTLEDALGCLFCREEENRGCYFAVSVIFSAGAERYNKCIKGERSVAVRGTQQ